MHRGYSIQNCTLQTLCDRVTTFFLLFVSYVILKLIKVIRNLFVAVVLMY